MIHIDKHQLDIVRQILEKQIPNKKVVAFGSRVRGDFKANSDLDLCVIDKEPLSLSDMGRLREAFSNSDLPMKVDIVEWQSINNDFQKIIKACCENIGI